MRSEQHFARYVFLGLLVLLALSQVAAAGSTTALNDWCVNVNGDIATACNGGGGGGASGLANINMANFDTTLGTNNLGYIVITNFTGYASFYADYDLNFTNSGSFQDSATAVGTVPSNWSYEADDPNTSSIFTDFANSALGNTNNVGTASLPPNVCCDVAFALSVSDVGAPETLTFLVSTTAPTSGFYIQQTNLIDGDSIYLSATESGNTNSPPIPEPSTLVLAALGGLSVLLWRRLSAA